jgi:ABC-2 type transport system permease protein
MSIAYAIARRELTSFFCSPIAYVALTLFMAVTGYLFANDFTPGTTAGLRSLFEWMVWLLVFLVPVLCMGLLSSEWDRGTIETLLTAPVSEASIVLGKFLGSLLFFLVLLVPTLIYVVILSLVAHPDPGPMLSGYIGIILVGAMFTSIGLFCSSLTRSQVIAAVTSAAFLSLITILPAEVAGRPDLPTFWSRVVEQLVYQRYADFSRGVIERSHVIFFLSVTGVFLFLTIKVLESRRWK